MLYTFVSFCTACLTAADIRSAGNL